MIEISAFFLRNEIDIVLVLQVVVTVHVSEVFAILVQIKRVVFAALDHFSLDLSLQKFEEMAISIEDMTHKILFNC